MKKTLFILASTFIININAQIITTVAGNGSIGYAGDGGQATAAQLNEPYGIAFDGTGNYSFVDLSNNCIRKVSKSSGIIKTSVGNGSGVVGFSGDGGQATAATLNQPNAITFDAAGNLFIADSYNHRIRKVNTSGIINTIAGNGSQGFSGDGGQATAAALYDPSGVAVDATGNVYIVDSGNNRVRKVSTSGIITTIVGNGTANFSGDGGQATAAELNSPVSIAISAQNNMYVTDAGNSRLRKINTSGIITTVAGNGTGGYSGDGGQATAADINPFGIITDASGNLYITDFFDNVIRKVNTSGIITTIVGNSAQGFSGDGGLATAAEVDSPTGIAFDQAGNLYITDGGNERVRMVSHVSVGIDKITGDDKQLSIYPNPSNGIFVIEASTLTKQTIQMFDVNGKLVLTQSLTGKTTIDATSLTDGIYYIGLVGSEVIENKKLVIIK